MSWRRFTVLLSGLSPTAVYRLVASRKKPLTAKDAPAFFAQFPKRSER